LTVAYNGAAFHGFARQEGLPTVQGELESALATLLRREVPTTGAGRTDTGVHAHGQVVSFPIAPDELAPRSLRKLQTSLNALTCNDLVIRDVTEKPAGFSARFSAIEREYRYRLYTREAPPLFLAPFVWWVPRDKNTPLDITAMKQAASLLIGEHDFASFCVAKSAEGIRTMRELKEIFIFGIQHLGEPCIVIQVRGNAFLHSMVRVIVGSLVEVGKRNRPPEWLGEVLAARDRRAAGQTAPAQGLTLWQVRYPQQ
jgi:tRNA pseudouridine38-40 synthase